MIRPRLIQGEGHVDFLGESEGSLPQPHDSLPDAGEAIHDFWSMSGSFIYRHHVEPRVKLYSPREESFPIPLKYIDVTRTTHTNSDVKQEKRIDDYWNIDGSRDLSVKIPAAKAAVEKEWEKLEKFSAWNLTNVKSKRKVIDEARTSGATVHFASLMDICHLKNAELEAKHQKYKGRVVLCGDIVKDNSGSYAVFTEQ